MKAKLIHQTLDEHRSFNRGRDPKEAMDLGLKAKIRSWLSQMEIDTYTINDDLTIDVRDDGINVYLDRKGLSEFPDYIRFGRVRGSFNCSNNRLVSLVGCPRTVDKFFACNNNELTSLEGCPKSVGKDFICVGMSNRKKFTEEEIRRTCSVGRYVLTGLAV